MTGGRNRALSIIFHSGSWDRVHHGLSIALAAAALGRQVRLFFAYGAVEHLRRNRSTSSNEVGNPPESRFTEAVRMGHMEDIDELMDQVGRLGAKIFACTNAMSIFNITRGELREEVDKPMGLTNFLAEGSEDQLIFI
jgi:peroxiredoxin family protein